MIHGGKKWSTLTAAVLLALGAFSLPQMVWAAGGYDSDTISYTEGVFRVKNMVQSTSDTDEATNDKTTAKGVNAIAFGVEAKATGNYAMAIGYKATANKGGSTALGYSATAGREYTTALGYKASASSKNATAVGYQAKASGDHALAIGSEAYVDGSNSSAVGAFNNVYTGQSAAIGYKNEVSIYSETVLEANAYAFGSQNTVYGKQSTAIGYNNAIGYDSTSSTPYSVENSYVIGSNNTVLASNAFVFGSGVTVSEDATNSVALGNDSTVEKANTVSVGSDDLQRKIVHVAKGTVDTDAATYGQIAKTGQVISLSEGTREAITVSDSYKLIQHNQITTNDGTVLATFKEGTITSGDTGFVSGGTVYDYLQNAGTGQSLAGSDTISVTDGVIRVANMAQTTSTGIFVTNGSTKAWGANAIAFGSSAQASGANAIAFGSNASAFSAGALAIGSGAVVHGINSSAVGTSSQTSANQSAAIGYNNSVNGQFRNVVGGNMYAFGSDNKVYGNQSVAIGCNNTVGAYPVSDGIMALTYSVEDSYVIGSNNEVLASNAFVFGSGVRIEDTATNSVALGNGSTVEKANTVSVGSDILQRKIVHVDNGTENTDAANFGQIARAGQVISLSTALRDETISTLGKNNEIVANDGTVLATFKEGTITSGDTGFVSGGTVYDYLQNAGTGQSLAGSDTISVTDGVIKVENMAQSTSATDEVTNGTTKAKGDNAIAFGGGAQAYGDGSIAIGSMNYTDGDYTTTLGYNNGASADYSASIGYLNRASEEKTYAFGYDNAVFGKESSVVGVSNALYGVQSAAMGYNNLVGEVTSGINDDVRTVSGNRSYVVGADNRVLADDAFVFGSGIEVSKDAKNSVVLGNGSTVEKANTVSVGSDILQRKIVHVDNGTENTDAANFGQLITAKSYSATSSDITKAQTATLTSNDGASSVSISIAGEGQVAAGDQRLVSGDTVYQYIQDNISGGSSGSAADVKEIKENITTEGGTYIEAGTDVGKNLKALDSAIGEVKAEDGKSLNVITSDNEDGSKTSVAENLMKLDEKIGSLDSSRDPDSNARAMKYNVISSRNTISENLEALDDAATGATANLEEIAEKLQYEGASVTGDKAIGLGQGSEASGANAISFGTNATASADSALALGSGAKAEGANAISFGTNATASADSALALGNGAKAEGANAISFGSSATASKENALAFGNKATASAANTLAFGNTATASAENAMAFGNGASVSEGATGSVAIGSGSVASEANVVSFGAEGSERRLTNVAAGVNDTDAVNVGQMNSAIGENMNYLKSTLTRDINKVGAGSAALAALRPEGFDPDDKFSMAVGFGHYKNANAGAIGAFYKPNYDTTFSIGATLGDGESMMNMGVSFKLGSRGKRTLQTGAALSQEVASLRKNNESLKKDNASQATAIKEQAKEIADLKADNERMKADNERMKEQIAMILSKMELSEKVEKTMVKAG